MWRIVPTLRPFRLTRMPIAKTAFTALPDSRITVEGFDGSLELLLHLLDEEKLAITAVSLAAVADQYLQMVRLLPPVAQKLDYLAEFLVVGAQLLVLKSRALLPREAERRDEDDVVDEATLEARLREYRRFREAATHLHALQTRGERSFSRTAPPPLPPPAPPPRLQHAAPEALAAAFQRLLAARAPAPRVEAPPRVSLRDRISQVRAALAEHGRVSFTWLASDCATRGELIVTFLAVLELFRRHLVEIEQDGLFGEIWLAPAAPTSPPESPAGTGTDALDGADGPDSAHSVDE